ncbi:MAG TPA: signal peptidase I [Candidatus Paceibacterota bacterium]|nr:signal peptidase I [Candidatus Paceibacterota bacterium]
MDQNENITIDAEKIIPKKEKNFWRELAEIIFFVAIVVIPIQTFVGRTFIVVGSSMYPTFENKDYLIVDKLTYHFNDPKRGDVIIFHPPIDEKTYYIKRIIGLPNETVTVDGNKVIVKTETGEEIVLDEPYRSSDGTSVKTVELSDDEYFVMGDNRAVSSDSRVWGALPESNISGRAFLRLFPFRSLDAWPGSLDEFNE